MPCYSFKCWKCDTLVDITCPFADRTACTPTCPVCHTLMVAQPSAPNFAVHGFNAANKYSKETP